MKKFIFMILILLFANPSFSQTGTTAEMFGLDQCLWVETEDETVVNNYCAKMKLTDGSLVDNGDGSFSVTIGTGDVDGPASSNDNAITRFDGTSGKVIQNSSVFIDDSGRVGVGTSAPNTSVILDLSSTNKALRVPRVSNPYTDIIPARHGMLVYNSTDDVLMQYSNNAWSGVGSIFTIGDCAGPNCFNNDDGGTQLTFQLTGDTIHGHVDDTLTYWIDQDGEVTFQGRNQSQIATDTVYDTYLDGTIRLGSSDVTSIEIQTDGTGTDELIVPRDSIGPDEIGNQDSSEMAAWINDELGTGQVVFSSTLDDYVVGPASATDNAIARYDGTTGKLIQNTSGVTIDDSNNIVLPTASAGATQGFIYKGSTKFLHDFYPTGGATGANIFLGNNAGNTTMTSSAAYMASNNIGIGAGTLSSLTTGYQNIAIGSGALGGFTSGGFGFALGNNAFQFMTGQSSTAVGHQAGRYLVAGGGSGYGCTLVGSTAGLGVSTVSNYAYVTAVGFGAGLALTSGTGNTLVGDYAGGNITSGQYNIILGVSTLQASAATTTTGSNNIIIGKDADVSSASASNELNIGDTIYGSGMYGTGSIRIGAATPTARLHLPAGTTSASSAPLKLTSGSLMTTAEAGAVEFLTDKGYLTITTGAARKELTLNDAALTSGTFPVATTNGRLTDSAFTSTNLTSGTYTPTRSAEANLDSNVTMTQAQYLRVGNTVTVSGAFTADPTTTTTATSFEFSLPIASNIGAVEDSSGVAFCGAIAGQGARISGSVANNTAVVTWLSGDVTSQSWSYTFTYEIL